MKISRGAFIRSFTVFDSGKCFTGLLEYWLFRPDWFIKVTRCLESNHPHYFSGLTHPAGYAIIPVDLLQAKPFVFVVVRPRICFNVTCENAKRKKRCKRCKEG